MIDSLPTQWAVTDLSALGGTVGGKTPSKANPAFWKGGSIPWVSPKDMKRFEIGESEEQITESAIAIDGMRLLPPGSVLLVTRSGILAHTLPVAITTTPVTINQDLKAIRPMPTVNSRYLAYAFRALESEILTTCTKAGTTVASVEMPALEKLPLPLAPYAEQHRIADKLDTVLARVDAVNTRLDRVAPILKRFRQSVLTAATVGALTGEGRLAHDKGSAPDTTLQETCQQDRVITYGVVKLGEETPAGIPCLRTSNVRWLRFELEGMKRIHSTLSAEYRRTVLRGGEVLVNVRGTLGGVAVATADMKGWNVSREVAVVPVDGAIAVPAFIALWIASDESQRWLTGVSKGVAYTGINIEDLRTLPLKLPSKDEQTEIVRRVEALFAFADRLEARLVAAQAAADRLTPTLLAKAFRGELVPQDPADEPAAELLKRLETQRAAEPKRGRGRPAA